MHELLLQLQLQLLLLKLLLQNRKHACARDRGRGYRQRVTQVGLQLLLELGGQHECLHASQSFDRGEKRRVHKLQRLIDWLSQLNSTGYWY